MVADVRLGNCYCTHLGLPRTPPLASSRPPCNAAPRSVLEKQLGGTPGRRTLPLARQPVHCADCGGSTADHGRPEKSIIPAAGRRDFGEGKVRGISEGRAAASKKQCYWRSAAVHNLCRTPLLTFSFACRISTAAS